MSKRVNWCAIAYGGVVLMSCATDVIAQDRECSVRPLSTDLRGGRILEIRYELGPSARLCVVTLRVWRGENPVSVEKAQGDVGLEEAKGEPKFIVLELEGDADLDELRIDLNSVPQLKRLPWQVGAAWYRSLESRQSTPSLGQQQALGGVLRVGFPDLPARGLELSVEASLPAREAIDSQLLTLSSERRVLKDSIVSAAVGRAATLSPRFELAGLVGGGVAVLDTQRYTYTAAGGIVRTVQEGHSSVAAVGTLGADLRVTVLPRLQVVINDRIHLVAGQGDAAIPRPTLQHRPGIGFMWNWGGNP